MTAETMSAAARRLEQKGIYQDGYFAQGSMPCSFGLPIIAKWQHSRKSSERKLHDMIDLGVAKTLQYRHIEEPTCC